MMASNGAVYIVSWNCNGIQGRLDEFKEFIKEHTPDLILLQETHLRPANPLKIPNYDIIRNDYPILSRGRAIRGTAICIKKDTNYTHVQFHNLLCLNATGINVYYPNTPPITIVSVYVPCGERPNNVITDIKYLLTLNQNILLMGDFNAQHRAWNCSSNTHYGTHLHNLIQNSSTIDIIFPPTPTHFTYTNSLPIVEKNSTIDFGLFRGLNYVKEISSLCALSSDHNPVKLSIQIHRPPQANKTYKSTDWKKFFEILKNKGYNPPNLNNISDIESLVDLINRDISEAHEEATKTLPKKDYYKLDPHVKILINNKNRARKKWQRTRNPNDKRIMNAAQESLKIYLRKRNNDHWSNLLNSLSADDCSLWKITRRIKNSFTPVPPIKHPIHQNLTFTDSEKANAIAISLEDQFQPNNFSDPETETVVMDTLNNYFSNPPPPQFSKFHLTMFTTKLIR